MRFIIIIFFSCLFLSLSAQQNHYLKISGGPVFFGSGDINGYGIYTEYAWQLGKNKSTYWRHFQLGAELGFETGVIKSISINPPPSNYLSLFAHISSTSLYANLAYYPFATTFLKGLHVAIGPTGGYYLLSTAERAEFFQSPDGTVIKESYLAYDNTTFIGYKISAGYDYYFKKILVGARLDWSNNQKGDINTMYGLKVGFKL